jgi:hypothetical protein
MVSPRPEPSLCLDEEARSGPSSVETLRNYGFHLLAVLLGIALAFM